MTRPRLPKTRIIASVLTLLASSFFLAALGLKYFIFPLAFSLYYLTHLLAILLDDERKAIPASLITFSAMQTAYITLASLTGLNLAAYMDLPLMLSTWLTGTITYTEQVLSKKQRRF